MNAAWLRQDPVLRALPRWIVWSLATTLLLLALALGFSRHVQTTRGYELGPVASAACFGLVLWLPAVVVLLSRGSRRRASPFDLSLPVTTQQLWMRHLVATSLCGALLVLTIGAITGTVIHLMSRLTESSIPLPPGGMPRLTATLMISFALTVTLIQSATPDRILLPASRQFAARTGLVCLATFALAVLWIQLPLLALGLPVLATWLLARWGVQRLPQAWSLESAWPGPGEVAGSAGTWDATPPSVQPWRGLGWHVFLLRAMHSGTPKAAMTLWVGAPLLLGFGALLSGAFGFLGEAEFRWTMLFISIYMVFALIAKPLGYLHPLDALPLSRRRLFALLTLPNLLLLVLGYGAGQLFSDWKRPAATPGIRLLQSCAGVGVPTEFHSISWTGAAEPVVAPWGEAHAPFTAPLFASLKPRVVSRFCTRDSNVTLRFQMYQASQAAEAVYGESPADDALWHFLTDRSDSTQAGRILEVGPPRRNPARASIFPVVLTLICLGSFGTLALYLRTFRVGRLDRLRKVVFVGLLVFLLALHMAQFVLLALHVTSLWAWDVVWRAGTRSLAAALPGGTPTLWVLAVLLSWIAYRIAERQFERAELPRSDGKARC